MPTVEELADVRAAANTRDVENHCPFGCNKGDLDEFGYCPHLIGFTNDGKTAEGLRPWKRYDPVRNEWVDSADRHVTSKAPVAVLDTDVLVNPSRQIVDKGVKTTAHAWVSSRVYRHDVKPVTPDGLSEVRLRHADEHACDQCEGVFGSLQALKQHKRFKHPDGDQAT